MGDTQTASLQMENRTKMDENWGYSYFRKATYGSLKTALPFLETNAQHGLFVPREFPFDAEGRGGDLSKDRKGSGPADR